MKKKILLQLASILFLLGLVVLPHTVGAADLTSDDLGLQFGTGTGLTSTDVRETAANIIRIAMGLLGIIAVIIILVGGFTWMTAGGNEEKVGTAKKYIMSGVIGLVIVICAYAIASYVINSLLTATGSV